MLLVIPHAHTLAAQVAQHSALKQRRSFARRPGSPFAGEGTRILCKPMLIGFEAFPIDVARVHARHDKLPLGPGNLDGFRAAVWHMARACAAIHESPAY